MTFRALFQCILTLGAAIIFSPSFGQNTIPINGPRQFESDHIAFVNAHIIVSPEKTIESGTLVIRDGKVVETSNGSNVPKGALKVDVQGAWIYPGFIDPFADYLLPLPEKKKTEGRGKPQYESKTPGPWAWNEAIKPEFEAVREWTPDPETMQELRKVGFTEVNVVPNDGIIRGTSSLVHLNENKVKKAIFRERSSLCMSFKKGSSSQSYPSSLMGAMALIRQTLSDAEWYANADPEEKDLSMEMLSDQLNKELPILFETKGWLNSYRALRLAEETGKAFILKTEGDEFKQPQAFQNQKMILDVVFPKPFKVNDPAETRRITLGQLMEWEQAPNSASILRKNQNQIAFTASGLKEREKFLQEVRKTIVPGFSQQDALRSLTLTPASFLHLEKEMGSLEKGKLASFFIADGNIFEKGSEVISSWSKGKPTWLKTVPAADPRGTFAVNAEGTTFILEIYGNRFSPKVRVQWEGDTTRIKVRSEWSEVQASFSFEVKKEGQKTPYKLEGLFQNSSWTGYALQPDGSRTRWAAIKTGPSDQNEKADPAEPAEMPASPFRYPFKSYGFSSLPETENLVIRNATVWTNTAEGTKAKWDVWIKDGKINVVGPGINAPGAAEIDGTGLHLTTGIIDEHSHIAISEGVNEGSHAVTAEVRIGDVINSEDINIYRQLAGGVTCSQLLHGSANPIGGQSGIIKLRWGQLPEEMKVERSRPFIKFALGENVKQSNWGDQYTLRYPQTRPGVEQTFRDAFQAALDYKEKKEKATRIDQPFRVDYQMETLLEILDSRRFVTCHSYVQSEINMLMKVAESYGFRINTFTHVLEGYKIADKLKAHGANASTFSDWWAYKYEVIDAIPHNAALLSEMGVNTCINSDDAEMGRRLNQEAAKAVKYGGLDEEAAWKLVTLNAAKALRLDDRMGMIKKGYDADLVLWTANPLSIDARVRMTLVDGKRYYDLEKDAQLWESIQAERARILLKMANSDEKETQDADDKNSPRSWECDTLESDY